jgi:hypothetical protein
MLPFIDVLSSVSSRNYVIGTMLTCNSPHLPLIQALLLPSASKEMTSLIQRLVKVRNHSCPARFNIVDSHLSIYHSLIHDAPLVLCDNSM